MQPQTQITGRMGELVVELELLKRGWWATNFNSATTNFVGWDLFAAKQRRSIKIRIKSKRPGETMFRWGAKSRESILPNLNVDDASDFVAAVSLNDTPKGYEIYIIPSILVEKELAKNHKAWLSESKKDGSNRKDSSNRIIYMDDKLNGISRGYVKKWENYLEAWHLLEQ